MKLSILPLLVAIASAESVIKCLDCANALKSDCQEAYNQFPTSGTLSGNDNSIYTSGSCSIRYWPDGVAADAGYVHGDAEALINQCCTGSGSCSGVAYSTGSSDELADGCLCVGSSSSVSCNCAGGEGTAYCI
jgi:hypothetical protein